MLGPPTQEGDSHEPGRPCDSDCDGQRLEYRSGDGREVLRQPRITGTQRIETPPRTAVPSLSWAEDLPVEGP